MSLTDAMALDVSANSHLDQPGNPIDHIQDFKRSSDQGITRCQWWFHWQALSRGDEG